jgi:hypothetical protein
MRLEKVVQGACGPTQIRLWRQPWLYVVFIHDEVRFGCEQARAAPPM